MFDLTSLPAQLTTDPDPIEGLNAWTQAHFPALLVAGLCEIPDGFVPGDEQPVIFWRTRSAAATDQSNTARFEGEHPPTAHSSYAVNWYTGEFAAELFGGSAQGCLAWAKAIAEHMQLDGEVVLADGSPLFVKKLLLKQGEGNRAELILIGQYGVLAQHRRERAGPPLNNANFERR